MPIRDAIENFGAAVGSGLRRLFGRGSARPAESRESDVGDEHGSVTAEPRGDARPGEPESSPRGIGGMDF
ncbi:hypothetical protein [Nocardia transvalensis]|uniref:hypothetical protein n=1 Tax=Nocardia transvalensis TaxID=37333 RepID=UPI0018960C47|nr:hypothetical protein [Nocardia transvalensis]MBF6327007.1 hypothetical protein [Nocardia transvalensis]